MATIRYTIAAVALALAVTSRAANAQSASVSLTHTVVVTVPPRVKVQVAPALSQQQQPVSGQSGLAVNVNATRGWALVVGSRKDATPIAQLVASKGDRTSSMVLYRSQSSKRSSGSDGVSDSEPMILTVVAP